MSVHHTEDVMGTTISIDLVDCHDRGLAERVFDWFHHVDEVFSPYKETSVVTAIGRGEIDLDDAAVDDDVREVLSACERLDLVSGGVFDVWHLPSPNGTCFDPCGYVKGWSVQRAAGMVRAEDVHEFCLNAGGDIALGGRNHDGEPWRIGIRHPHHRDRLALVVRAEGPLAVATSGTYERGAHIIDPRNGQAVTDASSVTVIGPDLGEADAYATTVFALGGEGLAWLQDQPGYQGCVIDHELQVHTTPGFGAHLA